MKILYDNLSYSKEDFVELIMESTISKKDELLIDLFEIIYLYLVSINPDNSKILEKMKPILLFMFVAGSTVNQLKLKKEVKIVS